MRACVHACVRERACVHACVSVRACVCVRACGLEKKCVHAAEDAGSAEEKNQSEGSKEWDKEKLSLRKESMKS